MEVIPAIDLLDGRCVRLFQGDYDRVTYYDVDVLELAGRYRDAGLERLHVVDLNGARDGFGANRARIAELVRTSGLRVQVGGGIRSGEMALRWLETGVERVVVGSAAVLEPQAVLNWLPAQAIGRLVPAFDVRVENAASEPHVVTHGWRSDSGHGLWQLLETYLAAGVRDFLCTDVGRDGTLAGPNNALYTDTHRRYPAARIIASGGVSAAGDLPVLASSGVVAVVTGRALLDGRMTVAEISSFSRGQGHTVPGPPSHRRHSRTRLPLPE
jgi:phosphoribosylformimino-5-aminoimidazole carboxamide ribotide isomerase